MADFIHGCMSEPPTTLTREEFGQVFCKRCRNAECVRAEGLNDKFRMRVSTQADLLLRPKKIVTPSAGSQFENLKDFIDMTHQAVKLEIADHKGDWTLPDETPSRFQPVETKPHSAPPLNGPPPPIPASRNVPHVAEGIMVGGGPAPASPITPRPHKDDTWEIKQTIPTVQPGAKIKLGGQ